MRELTARLIINFRAGRWLLRNLHCLHCVVHRSRWNLDTRELLLHSPGWKPRQAPLKFPAEVVLSELVWLEILVSAVNLIN